MCQSNSRVVSNTGKKVLYWQYQYQHLLLNLLTIPILFLKSIAILIQIPYQYFSSIVYVCSYKIPANQSTCSLVYFPETVIVPIMCKCEKMIHTETRGKIPCLTEKERLFLI